MNIAVCIKQVPLVSALEFDPATKTLKREGVRTEVSAFDVRALLKAVELAAAHGGEVTAITMGPPQAREALLECLALGADRAVHLCDRAFAGADTLATAEALAAALRRQPFDLVICGRNSVDAETAQVGPEVAELLDLPQVTGARALAVDPRKRTLTAERETDDGLEMVEAPLPALVTAAEDLAPERFASKAERAAAASKPIEEIRAADLDVSAERLGQGGSPTWVLGLAEVEVERQGRMLDPENLEASADELVARLLEHGLFGEWKTAAPAQSTTDLATVARAGEKDVLVVGELVGADLRRVTLELLSKGRELAGRIGGTASCLLVGRGAERHVEALAAHGAETILLAEEIATSTEPFARLLTDVVRERRPGIVLVPSTAWGRDVAPRVAARLRLGLTGDCVDLELDAEGRLLQHKPAFGGSIVALIASRTRPEMATVRSGMLPVGTARAGARVEVVKLTGSQGLERVRLVSREATAPAAPELDHAAVVLGVGKGIGGPENLGVVAELARVLDAPLCTTRDVTDAGWLPKQLQVGLTGRAIAPRLYVAVALRGAFEHAVGVRRAGLVVAINRSAKAPIFRISDYGIAADYAAVVPLLAAKLAAAKQRIAAARETEPRVG